MRSSLFPVRCSFIFFKVRLVRPLVWSSCLVFCETAFPFVAWEKAVAPCVWCGLKVCAPSEACGSALDHFYQPRLFALYRPMKFCVGLYCDQWWRAEALRRPKWDHQLALRQALKEPKIATWASAQKFSFFSAILNSNQNHTLIQKLTLRIEWK